jgi:homospermidine synthase
MLVTNINFLIFLKDFTLIFNYDVRKKEQAFNEKKLTLIVINKKFIKKNEKYNNANLKFVDQLISKKEIKNIANQNQKLKNFDRHFFIELNYKYKNRSQDIITH